MAWQSLKNNPNDVIKVILCLGFGLEASLHYQEKGCDTKWENRGEHLPDNGNLKKQKLLICIMGNVGS